MGAQIAAHVANAGVRVLLLDLTGAIAREGLKRAQRLKPDPFFTPGVLRLIETGGFDLELPRLAEVDWIVEAVVEQIDVKRSLLERVEAARRPGTIVTSNTSGIPLAALSAGRGDDFRRHWLGTHFFNPPRYLRLLEIIPTPETDPGVVDRVSRFADVDLGKGIVVARDTPGFIANRIGLFGIIQAIRALESGDYTIEEIDAITGPALGRPKSATFRTADIAGIDVLGLVARNLADRLPDAEARAIFRLPALVAALIERGWIGEKAGQGFYKREASDILTLDPATARPTGQGSLRGCHRSTRRAPLKDVGARVKTLFLGPDRVGAFLRKTLGPTLIYTARVALSIAHTIDEVDRAMRWGFGWELGPFETWDAIGVHEVLAAVGDAGDVPPLAAALLSAGRNRFRDDGCRRLVQASRF